MKDRFVPFEKRPPKEQREELRRRRHLWQGIKLCTRVMADKKTYRRKGRRIDPTPSAE